MKNIRNLLGPTSTHKKNVKMQSLMAKCSHTLKRLWWSGSTESYWVQILQFPKSWSQTLQTELPPRLHFMWIRRRSTDKVTWK